MIEPTPRVTGHVVDEGFSRTILHIVAQANSELVLWLWLGRNLVAVEKRSLSLLDVGITGSSQHISSSESLTPGLRSPAAVGARNPVLSAQQVMTKTKEHESRCQECVDSHRRRSSAGASCRLCHLCAHVSSSAGLLWFKKEDFTFCFDSGGGGCYGWPGISTHRDLLVFAS